MKQLDIQWREPSEVFPGARLDLAARLYGLRVNSAAQLLQVYNALIAAILDRPNTELSSKQYPIAVRQSERVASFHTVEGELGAVLRVLKVPLDRKMRLIVQVMFNNTTTEGSGLKDVLIRTVVPSSVVVSPIQWAGLRITAVDSAVNAFVVEQAMLFPELNGAEDA